MDTKGFVDTLKHYGSNGCDVVGNGTTTTIVGDEGQITLEKLRETESALYGHFNHADTYGLEQKMFKHNQNLK